MWQALGNSKAKRPCAREGGVGRLVVLGVDDSKVTGTFPVGFKDCSSRLRLGTLQCRGRDFPLHHATVAEENNIPGYSLSDGEQYSQ
jgi:hypothetical protein